MLIPINADSCGAVYFTAMLNIFWMCSTSFLRAETKTISQCFPYEYVWCKPIEAGPWARGTCTVPHIARKGGGNLCGVFIRPMSADVLFSEGKSSFCFKRLKRPVNRQVMNFKNHWKVCGSSTLKRLFTSIYSIYFMHCLELGLLTKFENVQLHFFFPIGLLKHPATEKVWQCVCTI